MLNSVVLASDAGAHALTVEDVLNSEGIGNVQLADNGGTLFFDHLRAFETMPDFGHFDVIGQYRSQILAVPTEGHARPAVLPFERPRDGYRLSAPSPDRRRFAYYHMSATALALGVYDTKKKTNIEFAGAPDIAWYTAPQWISNETLVYARMAMGRQPERFTQYAEHYEQLAADWQTAHRGQTATARVMGSGQWLTKPPDWKDGALVLANARTGDVRVLQSGNFVSWNPSPDGRFIAAIRIAPVKTEAGPLLDHSAGSGFGWVRRELVVCDVASGKVVFESGDSLNVSHISLQWSPDSKKLALFATRVGATWQQGAFEIWSPGNNFRAVDLGVFKPFHPDGYLLNVDIHWAFGQPLVAVFDPKASKDRLWLQPGHGLLHIGGITTGIDVLYITGDRLAVSQGGKLWAISTDGNSKAMSAASTGLQRAIPSAPNAASATLVTHVVAVMDDAGNIQCIDVHTGHVSTTPLRDRADQLVAVGPDFCIAVAIHSDRNVGYLDIDRPTQRASIFAINRHFNDIEPNGFVQLDYKSARGSPRRATLLLPPHWNGKPLPTIVWVYPGSIPPSVPPPFADVGPNMQLFAARGFAVLYPKVDVASDIPREPLAGLAGQVLRAVKAASAAGYVDPDRMAIVGHSFGANATLGIIEQTDKFRAAIAIDGTTDLFSAYGTAYFGGDLLAPELFGPSFFETDQGGMGAPPWVDPKRYERNSPLLGVSHIHTPVLLVHGDLDGPVPFSQGEEMFTALYRLGKDCQFIQYRGEPHFPQSPANIRDLWSRSFSWIRYYLGGRAPSGREARFHSN